MFIAILMSLIKQEEGSGGETCVGAACSFLGCEAPIHVGKGEDKIIMFYSCYFNPNPKFEGAPPLPLYETLHTLTIYTAGVTHMEKAVHEA